MIFGVWRRVALDGWAATLASECQPKQQPKPDLLSGVDRVLVGVDGGLGGRFGG